eukprot:30330-Eustigmatos_ZCMA.PRE.1
MFAPCTPQHSQLRACDINPHDGLREVHDLRSPISLCVGACMSHDQTSSGAVPSASACYEAGLPPSFSKDAFPFCEVVEPNVLVLYWNHDVQDFKVHGELRGECVPSATSLA